jgi:benzoyl-CoA reductase/2-hydroxyglutaryl-CoA dehydratase subunit BcrC/BadD/HgdB
LPPLDAIKRIKDVQMEYYAAAHNAPSQGRLVAYLNVFTPVELLYAMDIFPVYPENHAAVVGVRKLSGDVCRPAEAMGYHSDLCSYARCDLGSIKAQISPTWGLPRPDILIVSNAQCGTLHKWFEVLSRLYNVPMVLIDVPHSENGEPDPAAETYVRRQLEDLIRRLETMTGKPLDSGKLREAVDYSRSASDLWIRVLDAAASRPAPITVFDQFIAMAPIVSQRGTRAAVDFYEPLVDELENRVKQGIGAVTGERRRLYWDNLPIWPELRRFSAYLDARGAAMVTSIYTWAWSQLGVGHDDPIGDWVRQYLYTFNLHFDARVSQYAYLAERFHLDGFVYHSNRSCKWLSQDISEVRRAVAEKTGLPGVIIEGDQCDSGHYDMAVVERQLDSFLDMY